MGSGAQLQAMAALQNPDNLSFFQSALTGTGIDIEAIAAQAATINTQDVYKRQPVESTDDWCFATDHNGVITEEKVGGTDCHQTVSYTHLKIIPGMRKAYFFVIVAVILTIVFSVVKRKINEPENICTILGIVFFVLIVFNLIS